jgi:hypothetical protein
VEDRRRWKWLAAGIVGLTPGLLMLYLFQSIPVASTTGAATVVVVIILQHIALAIAMGSPFAALFKSIKPTLHNDCPFAGKSCR